MSGEQPARVLVSYGNSGVAESPDGRQFACRFRRAVGRPCCGDLVRVSGAVQSAPVVEEILPRKNEFMRAGANGRKQAIAANLDQVVVVVAPAPEPSRDLLERYLVAVHSLGMQPLIVLNKSERLDRDRLSPDSPLLRLGAYLALGYTVLKTSCKGPPGIEALTPALRARTSILVGQSGVGKSSLVNALLPDLELQTGELSRVTGKGTHTTTTTIMYRLPCGGRLVDSPGVWEYGLWPMSGDELADGFIEFRPYAGCCRFNDCRHASEPGCAIRAAAEVGVIHPWRYQSYLRLQSQVAS